MAKVGGRDYGRMAMRHEGLEWVAYYAKTDTMEGALRLGAINYNIIAQSERARKLFVNLMKEVITDVMRQDCGQEIDWRAPSRPVEQPPH